MTDQKRRSIGTIGLTLGLIVLMLIWLLTALHIVGTDGALYHRLQLRAWDGRCAEEAAGISDGDLQALDLRLADYLRGDEGALVGQGEGIRLEVWGAEQPAFNDREMTHLRDCFGLFELLRKVRSRLVPWAVLLIVGGAYLLQDRRRARNAALLAPVWLLAPLLAFALWAAIDFDAAFGAFHRALFTNELWLLDPRTDLLIRICPERMFMEMGLRIAVYSAIGMLAVPALTALIAALWPRRKEENTWNNRDMRRGSGQKQMTFGGGAKR